VQISFQDILTAYTLTAKSSQKKALSFEVYSFLNELYQELLADQYKPSSYNCFVVKDPKVREIFSPSFRDRLVHHLIVRDLTPPLESQLIYDSHANRQHHGSHLAVKRLQRFMRQSPQKSTFFIQLDIRSYFTTIAKDILFDILKGRIQGLNKMPLKQKNWLLNEIVKAIFHNPSKNPKFTGNRYLLKTIPPEKSLFHQDGRRGLPIGSLTSQFFSAIYLDELDQFVKHSLGAKRYVRYVDDFVIVDESPQRLNTYLKHIDKFLMDRLALRLNHKKTHMQPVHRGCDFLGYVVRPHYILMRKRTVRAFKRRLTFFNHLLDPVRHPKAHAPEANKLTKYYRQGLLKPGDLPSLEILSHMGSVLNSYYGIFRFANTWHLRRGLYFKHFHKLQDYFYPSHSFTKMKLKPIVVLKNEGMIEI
jgi:RNA-directed DNA polymerase